VVGVNKREVEVFGGSGGGGGGRTDDEIV